MTTRTKKYMVSFPAPGDKRPARQGFYALAKKHIVKGKRGGSPNLSKKIDDIVYGA